MTSKRFRRLRSLDELKSRLANRPVICSVSGGKDSVAMCLWLRECGIDYESVFFDTGWEHPETIAYVRDTLPHHIGPIRVVRAEKDMIGLIRQFGFFPSRVRRWCTDKLKIRPMRRYLRSIDVDVVNAVGIRAQESRSRSVLPAWDREREYFEVWRPILRWPIEEVWSILATYGVPRNPLYDMGCDRVGCWPCIHSSRTTLLLIADREPGRIDLLRALEAEISAASGLQATWFCSTKRGNAPLPIDDAVAIARKGAEVAPQCVVAQLQLQGLLADTACSSCDCGAACPCASG